jgi:hypothetical protein
MKIRPVGAKVFHADGNTEKYDEASNRFLRTFEMFGLF